MAIRIRRGLKEQFIPSKLLPGEFAVATDTGGAWYCYAAGKVLELATTVDLGVIQQEASNYQEAQQIIIDRIQATIDKNTADITADEKAILQNQGDIAGLQAGLQAANQDIVKMKDEVLAQIDKDLDTIESKVTANTQTIGKNTQSIKTLEANANNLSGDIADATNSVRALDESQKAIQLMLSSKIDGAYLEDGYLYLTSGNEVIEGPLGPFSGGGGGGGTGNNAVLTVSNTSGWLSKSIASGAVCEISVTWSSLEDELPTGNGTLKVTINGLVKTTQDVAQGAVTVDIGKYLSTGANMVKVNVTDAYGNGRTINYSVSVVDVSVSSTFDASVPYSGPITYTYTPVGNVVKTMHFVVDGTELGTAEVSASGRQQSYVIPAQSHGAHSLLVYFTAVVDGVEIKSNELYYELIYTVAGEDAPIITSSYRGTKAEQYASIIISYMVYNPGSMLAPIHLLANGRVVAALTVDRTLQTWTYRADTVGELTLEIVCGDVHKTIELTVTESSMDIGAETQDLSLHLSSYGRSNNEADPGTWSYGDIQSVFTGFNFSSDGWQLDADNNTVLRVAGDARLTIPYKAFAQDFRTGGKTIELEFATRDVMDYDAVVVSCMSGGRGIQLTAQKAVLKSEQSEISTQYKEDEHVRVSFVVEKRAEHRLIYCYINGVMSGTVQYPTDDDFAQTQPVDISVGSNDCTIDLYCIRVYDNDLTRHQMLNNWIADTQDVDTMLERYQHNNVFDAYGSIVIAQLPKDLPYLVMEAPELPQYKGDKKTVSGYYVDPLHPSKDFTFVGAQANVQGTSSQYYARKNYKISFKGGFVLADGTKAENYMINASAIPTNTYTFKADVASSEGANNVELVRLYNDACPYKTPPQVDNPNIRQGIDGFPIVMFWSNGASTVFLGKYNFNNDKGTPEVYGFQAGDESIEILNNTSDRALFKSADFVGDDWLNDFEFRYPEDYNDPTQLSALSTWLVSTDQAAATGAALEAPVTYNGVVYTADTAEYRLAKFKVELPEHAEVDSLVFYYLFTELFLMVDSRAKNAFPSFLGGDKWCFLPYDFDTAIGINNEGTLAFGYELEDIDQVAGADVYNGQDSVLWVNLRQAYFDEIKAMYQELRSKGLLSYEDTERRFEEHQSKWPEAVFNEDAYFKYLAPLIESNSAAYLSMLRGSKAEQRKWWMYNRYRYLDSKYNAGDALSDVITVRGYAKADITVTPYADIYASVKYGSYLVQQRALRGASYTLACPLDNVNDTEIYIYSASQLKDVGDLSGLMVGYAEFALATKLQALKLGDAAESYSNTNLTDLHLGNNVLLRTLDVRNCPNLTQAVDVSGCSNLEHVYFDGTGITGLLLPVGGILKTLHLPATITNLTIRNQMSLQDLSIPSYAGISTLRLENVSSAVDSKAILEAIPANSRVRLIGINWAAGTADKLMEIITLLDTMRGLDEAGNNTDIAQVSGTISVDTVTGAQLAEIAGKYPDIHVAYQHVTSNLYFYNDDGSTLLYTQAIVDGGDGTYSGSTPTKASTAQYTYSFAGWSKKPGGAADSTALKAVTADRSVYAAFTATVRRYTVKFYNGSTLLQTVSNVAYGGSATYTGTTPVSPEDSSLAFLGWQPTGKNITGNTSCYAQFESALEVKEITDDWATIIANIDNGTYKSQYKIGNYKPLDLGSEGVINMQMAGFDVDDLADGSGKAPITFIGKELLKTPHRMNPKLVTNADETLQEGTGSFEGWEKCEMRKYLKDTITSLVTELVRKRIAEVTKMHEAYNANWEQYEQVTQDGIWIPNRYEVTARPSSGEPIKYNVLFKNRSNKIKIDLSGTTRNWWLRDANKSGTAFFYISTDGYEELTAGGSQNMHYIAPSFCLRGPREITDTWEEIFAAEADGSYKEKYQISDYKPLDLGSEGIINMQIAGFDAGILDEDRNRAPITWIGRELLATKHMMNPKLVTNEDGTYKEGTGAIGGFKSSEMQSYLQKSIKPLIPGNVLVNIKPIKKYYWSCDTTGKRIYENSYHDLWIPSEDDLGSTGLYKELFSVFPESRVRRKVDTQTLEYWYLCNAYDRYGYSMVSGDGYNSSSSNGAADENGVCLCFCT